MQNKDRIFGEFEANSPIGAVLGACRKCVESIKEGDAATSSDLHRLSLRIVLISMANIRVTNVGLFKVIDLIITFMGRYLAWCQVVKGSTDLAAGAWGRYKTLVETARDFFGMVVPHNENMTFDEIVMFTRSDLELLKNMPDCGAVIKEFEAVTSQVHRYATETDHVISLSKFLMFVAEFNAWLAWLNREHESMLTLRDRNKVYPRLYYLLVYISSKAVYL